MKGIRNRIGIVIAKMAKKACYDSSGTASRSSMYEPEVQEDVKEWKETHESLLEKISKKFMKQ